MTARLQKCSNEPYVCAYCGKPFVKESTLFKHVCERKRRFLAKGEKHVSMGFQAFVRFFELTQQSKTLKTYDDFISSPYYNAFVKFGSFLSNTAPMYPQKFIDYVVTSGVKLDHWCRDELYDKYIANLIRVEHAETAVERSLATMQAWADSNNSVWSHYFKYVSSSRAVYDIKDGKISPWVLLNAPTGKDMIRSLSDEQLAMIGSIIDPAYWKDQFKKRPTELSFVKEVVTQGAL